MAHVQYLFGVLKLEYMQSYHHQCAITIVLITNKLILLVFITF